MKTPEVDKEWFTASLRSRRRSLRELAKHMNIDPSAVSRMFSGGRRMQVSEATSIAQFLGDPVREVLKHAGISADIDGIPTKILLTSTINEAGHVERLLEPRPLPQSVVERALAAIGVSESVHILAAQIRASEGPLAFLDDAIVLFASTDEVDPAAIGSLSICRSMKGDQVMAKIERARKTGEARLISTNGKVKEFDLQTATPVIAIIP